MRAQLPCHVLQCAPFRPYVLHNAQQFAPTCCCLPTALLACSGFPEQAWQYSVTIEELPGGAPPTGARPRASAMSGSGRRGAGPFLQTSSSDAGAGGAELELPPKINFRIMSAVAATAQWPAGHWRYDGRKSLFFPREVR